MNADAPDDARIFKSHPLPRLARVRRFVHAVAVREVAADAGFAHPDVNYVRIGLADFNRAHRSCAERLPIGDRVPRDAAVRRLEDATARASEVIDHRLRRHASDSYRTPA